MNSLLDIRVQKLFLIALLLKLGSAFFGWYLGHPWSLGFAFPLIVMVIYIALGMFRHDDEVTDEKFADSCYYLGFIFTITSIIFSLFDLPSIGTKIQEIAVRFGAAMVSTVLGLGVRVYLINFKKDVADAIEDAQESLLLATQTFTAQLAIVLDRLRDFESKVDVATQSSVERVNLHVEALSKDHSQRLAAFFDELAEKNQRNCSQALAHVKIASQRLTDAVDVHAEGLRSNLASVESRVLEFADAVSSRLQTTTFPDDYFTMHLNAPLLQLQGSAKRLADDVTAVAGEVKTSSSVLSAALGRLHKKSEAAEASLDTVLTLTLQQKGVLVTAQQQLDALTQLNVNLAKMETGLSEALTGLATSNQNGTVLALRVAALATEGATTRESMDKALSAVIAKLERAAAASDGISERLESNVVIGRAIGALGDGTLSVVAKADLAVAKLDDIGRHVARLEATAAGQIAEFRSAAKHLRDIKIAVEAPPTRSGHDLGVDLEPMASGPELERRIGAELISSETATSSEGRGESSLIRLNGVAFPLGSASEISSPTVSQLPLPAVPKGDEMVLDAAPPVTPMKAD